MAPSTAATSAPPGHVAGEHVDVGPLRLEAGDGRRRRRRGPAPAEQGQVTGAALDEVLGGEQAEAARARR